MSGIKLVDDTITNAELLDLADWISTFPRLTKGEKTIEFEKKWSNWLGSGSSLFVNSGSSANLIMAAALRYSDSLKNNIVIAPAVAWGTTVAPFMQLGFDVELCDCDPDTLGLDLDHLEDLLQEHEPSAVILVHVLGCPNKMNEIIELCETYDVILLEDCCEAHGAEYDGQKVGTFGAMSSFSFYYGHHMSTIEGGMVTFKDNRFYEVGVMLRSHGWIRDLDKKAQQFLIKKHKITEFNSLYFFVVPGFNVRSTDINAFLGLNQLISLPVKIKRRRELWNLYAKHLEKYVKIQIPPNSKISPLAFGFISEKRQEIVEKLIENDVECRPLICGSIHRHPFWKKHSHLPNADRVHDYGMYIPVHDNLADDDVLGVCEIIASVFS